MVASAEQYRNDCLYVYANSRAMCFAGKPYHNSEPTHNAELYSYCSYLFRYNFKCIANHFQ